MTSSSNKFPIKLYNILQEAETTPYLAEIVSWLPDGKSFKVHQKEEFSKAILSATFGTNVYKSFQRNLHFWGYHNIRKGPSKGVCSHPYFMKDRPELLSKMRRVRAPSKANEQDAASLEQHREEVGSPGSEKRTIPNYVFASAGSPRRVVSPSLTSTSSGNVTAALAQSASMVAPLLGANPSSTATLLMLLHQQQQNQQSDDQQQKALAEAIVVRQLLAQQEQQQQLQKLISALLPGQQEQAPAIDQGALTRALVSELLQQQQGFGTGAAGLLSGLLR